MAELPLHERLVQTPPLWEPFSRDWRQVVLASRVRVARNLAGERFPPKADAETLLRVEAVLRERLLRAPGFHDGVYERVDDRPPFERQMLLERRMITPELARGGVGRAFALARTPHATALVNEADHLRIQVVVPRLSLMGAWHIARAALAQLEGGHPFAYDESLGFLTSDPGSVGTGLRASAMLHLPGLAMRGCIDQVQRGLEKLGYSFGGVFGDGSEARGDLYRVANQSSLGETEVQILQGLTDVVEELARHETAARLAVVREETSLFYDHIGRAYGILRFSHLLSEEEALGGLSALAFGIRAGILRRVSLAVLNRLFLDVQAGHLQHRVPSAAEAALRDQVRAQVVREALGGRRS